MNLYESIKNNSTKLTESVNGFIHIVWGPDASEDELSDNERWELVGLVNAIEDAEDDYNNGDLDLESFINLIKEECKAHGLTDDETKKAVDFYEKSYKDEEQEDDEESFIMHNEDSDKDVRVWKQDGKWYDEEGNHYMGYLSKQDVKSYFKGNWSEVKESDENQSTNSELQDKAKALALDSEELKENVGDKNDYSEKILYLAKDFCNKELGKLRAKLRDYEIDSKKTPNAILYKLRIGANKISAIHDLSDDIGNYIADHIPSIQFVGTDVDNMTGVDFTEDVVFKFKQNTEFKDIGGDDVMED